MLGEFVGIFTFASMVIYCVIAIGAFVYSMLLFCDSKLAINDSERQYFNVRLYRLHFGFFFLGASLAAAAIAYLQFLEARSSAIDIVVLMFEFYGIFGTIFLSRDKRMKKNTDLAYVTDSNQLDDDKITRRDLLMIFGYLLPSVLLLIWILVFI